MCQRAGDVHEHCRDTAGEELPAVRVVPEVNVVAAGQFHHEFEHGFPTCEQHGEEMSSKRIFSCI